MAVRALRRALPVREIAPLQCRFEALLGESSATAYALAIDWFFYKQLERDAWADASTAAPAGVLLDASSVGVYLDHCRCGVVIATIHMGNYLEGVRQILRATSSTQPIFVLRRRQGSDAEQRLFQRVAGPERSVTVVRPSDTGLKGAVRALRRGAIVVVLYDLPTGFGRTVPVRFLGRPARFVRGPAELALVGHADVLPLLCHYDTSGTAVAQVMPVMAARQSPSSDRAPAVAALAQRLCTLAEAHIRRHPAQWAHWNLVDELLIPS